MLFDRDCHIFAPFLQGFGAFLCRVIHSIATVAMNLEKNR